MKTNRKKPLKLALETLKHVAAPELANVRGGEADGAAGSVLTPTCVAMHCPP